MMSQKPRTNAASSRDEANNVVPPGREGEPGDPQTQVDRIGDVLRNERERRGDDLQRIADHICIKVNFLAALENSDYDALPTDAYVIGFLRSYAVYLGFDGKEAIDRYRHEMAGRRRKPALAMPAQVAEGRAPSTGIIAAAVVAALLVYALWYGFSSSGRSAVSQPPALPTTTAPETPHVDMPPAPQPEATSAAAPMQNGASPSPEEVNEAPAAPEQPQAVAPAPVPAPVVQAQPAPPPAPAVKKPAVDRIAAEHATERAADRANAERILAEHAPANTHMQVHALQPSWILIKDASGNTVVDRVMKAGETYNVPDQKGLSLTTGNGSGVVLTLDGHDLPKLSTDSAHVMRDIPLDAAQLKSLPSQE